MPPIQPGQVYRHKKGNLYRIVAIAHHSETLEQLVIYEALYGDHKIWARPLAMFLDQGRYTLQAAQG